MSLLSRGFGSDASTVLEALSKSAAMIEFDLDGKILTANENFCKALGYSMQEIVGKHHSMFVDPAEAASAGYKAFWKHLGEGKFDQRQYKRIAKGGREIWIEASYNPVFRRGKPYKVVKIATDITASKLKAVEDDAKLSALSRAQAIIEFTPTGTIITANENFCNALGYRLEEIVGKHHSMFCDPAFAASSDYKVFWQKLAAGEFIADEFLRVGKGGRHVHIQASYNPTIAPDGKVIKVVKFATDVTSRVENVVQLAGALNKFADGELAQHIDKPFIPALERLRTDFNQAADKLAGAMRTVARNAEAISAGSKEIQVASDELAGRTEKQAASVEETAAALEEITTTVADASKRAEEAGHLVQRTKGDAEHSGVVVQDAIQAMDRIEKSSKEISNIIGVIDEIAFQTNLLALNAGVEAARAGEAGKGFAVVAQEVRELAQRSATAAKEIKSLINASGDHVRHGVALVAETGTALEAIVKQVQEINVNVTAIVEASREQSTGLKEINTAVNSIDQSTQQNAAMVEETTAASHGLAGEAQALFELLGQFKFGGGAEASRPRQPAPVRQSQAPVKAPAAARSSHPVRRAVGNAALAPADTWEEF